MPAVRRSSLTLRTNSAVPTRDGVTSTTIASGRVATASPSGFAVGSMTENPACRRTTAWSSQSSSIGSTRRMRKASAEWAILFPAAVLLLDEVGHGHGQGGLAEGL